MAAEARIIFRAESRQAQGEIQTLRGKLAQLNQTLAEQKNRLIGATAEEQKNIRAQMAKTNAIKATIRSRIEQANLQKQAVAQTQREARERERAAQQQIRASQQEVRERERAAQQQVRASQQISAAQRAVVQELTVPIESLEGQIIRTVDEVLRLRDAFVDLVNRLQDQGLSFDEARAKAEPYIDVLAAVSRPIEDADIAYRNFSSTLINESERSADAVANLLSGVQALGSYLGNRLPDVAGSLERSALNEQRYFQQNPIGLTIEEDQQRAGQQGRDYVNRLLGRQDQETERTEREAARETAQELREMASAIDGVIGELARFEGDIGSLTTKIGQFDIAGLASGNPLSIATLPFQLHDAFTFDQRHADARVPALDKANREAFERGEFGIPTDLLAFGRGHLSRATGLTDDPHLRALLGDLTHK